MMLVSLALLATFLHFYATENLRHNIVMVVSAEEERREKWSCVLKAT
jgi:hypothetical protein